MGTKEKKLRKHRILNIPIFGPVLGGLVTVFMAEIVIGMIGVVIDMQINSEVTLKNFTENGLVYFYVSAIGGLLMMLFFKLWYQGEYKGSFSKNFGDRKVKIAMIALLVCELAINIPVFCIYGAKAPTLVSIGQALMAGICEEVGFRVVPISVVMKKYEGKKTVVKAIVVSMIAFGLIHLFNIQGGQSVVATIFQILSAMISGYYFAALYLRTGNVLPCILLHFLHDAFAFMQVNISSGAMITSVSTVDIIQTIVLAVVCIPSGILMLKGKEDEIGAVWKERWNQN